MIQHCTLPISPAYQAVHVLVLISTQQPHGLKEGACSLAPPRASISQLEGERNRAHLCEWTGSPSPRSGHINSLGWYLTTHWHGMTTFAMYTARARGCWESCGVLMVTFPRCAWKESTKLQFDLVWNTHALCGVEDPQGPFNTCNILSPNDSDWRFLHWRRDLTITPSSHGEKCQSFRGKLAYVTIERVSTKNQKKKMAQANTRLSSLELDEPRSPSSRTIM